MVEGRGQELHRGGVNLAGLHGRLDELKRETELVAHIALERMSHLVGNRIDVKGAAVPVCKHEGTVAAHIVHVSAEELAGLGQHVEALVLKHPVDELLCLRAELVVHLLAHCEHVVGIACRLRVAVLKANIEVVELRVLDADALHAKIHELLCNRDQVSCDLLSVVLDVLHVVADAAHAEVGELGVVAIAHATRLLVAVLNHAAEDVVELLVVLVEPLAVGLARCTAGRGILAAHHVNRKLRERHLLALEFDHVARVELVILLNQCVVLSLEVNDALIRSVQRDLHLLRQNRSELIRENLQLRVLEERLVKLVLRVVITRRDTVEICLLAKIKLILGVHCIADIDGSVREIEFGAEALVRCPDIQNFLIGLRFFDPLNEGFVILLNARDIRTAVFKFAEFHALSPSTTV